MLTILPWYHHQCPFPFLLDGLLGLAVKALVQNGIDIKSLDGLSLHIAAAAGRLKVVTYLLSSEVEGGVVDTARTNANGDTVLHVALLTDQYEIMKYLLSSQVEGVNAETKNVHGRTALHLVAIRGSLLIVKYITLGPEFNDAVDKSTVIPHYTMFLLLKTSVILTFSLASVHQTTLFTFVDKALDCRHVS